MQDEQPQPNLPAQRDPPAIEGEVLPPAGEDRLAYLREFLDELMALNLREQKRDW